MVMHALAPPTVSPSVGVAWMGAGVFVCDLVTSPEYPVQFFLLPPATILPFGALLAVLVDLLTPKERS
jgi:hypothetical protein